MPRNKRLIFALLLMGFTSLIVQTLLIREFLITFYGNELTIGLILANWIILEALGSRLSSRLSLNTRRGRLAYAGMQAGIALYLPVALFLIRIIKNLLGLTAGEGVGALPILFSSFLILAPLSIFDGAQFPFGCRILSDATKKPLESAGRVYMLEAMGFILAGPIFTYLLITKFNSFSIAFFIGLVNLLSAVLLLKDRLTDKLTRAFFIIINGLLILMVLAFFGPALKIQKLSIDKQWRKQEVLDYRNSIYGNLAVTKSSGQYTFYSDGIPIITTPMPDIASIEELAHFTMLSHPDPKNVLILSGGAGGLISEALKYKIEKLDYAELDPLLIKLVKDFPTELTAREFNDPRLDIKHVDGRRFARLAKSRYDVVILNLPMPSTLQLNRFYTKEFFQEIRAILTEDGVFGFSLPGSLSYVSPEMRSLNGSILNTLEEIFHVDIIPGDANLYLASKNEFKIGPDIFLRRLKEEGIQTRLLNRQHLEYRLEKSWLEWFKDSLSNYTGIRKNLDLLPSAAFYSVAYWNALFSQRFRGFFTILDKLNFNILLFGLIFIGLALLIIKAAVPGLKRQAVGLAIFTTGFIGMGFDLILIYAYQAAFGFVFHHLALLVTAFMAGLTLGGWHMTRRLTKIKNDIASFSKIEFLIVVFCVSVGPLLLYINRAASFKPSILFFLLFAISGFLVGSEFPLANKIYRKAPQDKGYSETGGILYALDLSGAWLAALITSIALVPVIGILKTCIILAVLKTISLALVASTKD